MKVLLLTLFPAALCPAQGPLTPPGAPAPTQKSLQEIWNKIGVLETQLSQAQSDLTRLKADNRLLTGLLATSAIPFAWNITTVDGLGTDVGEHASLAFGPDGQPAIAYYDATNDDLKFARSNGSAWVITTVDSAGDVGTFASLAFDGAGQPAISYRDETNDDLKLARFSGGIWTPTTLDFAGDVGKHTSLAFAPDGLPSISYHDDTNDNLKYARFTGFIWSFVTIAPMGVQGADTSLKFGPDGQPAIAFIDSAVDIPKIARYTPTTLWTIDNVDVVVGAEESCSLAFGPDGHPAVAFGVQNGFKVARFNGAGWGTPVQVYTGTGIFGPILTDALSIQFGPNGQPAVAYSMSSSTDLGFALFDGSTWALSTVARTGANVQSHALAFGPDGQPAIAYYEGNANNDDLKFARKGPFPPAP